MQEDIIKENEEQRPGRNKFFHRKRNCIFRKNAESY